MVPTRQTGVETFKAMHGTIEEILQTLARRHRLNRDEAEEFKSWAMMKFIVDDYRRLRLYRGQSSWPMYLRAVAARLFQDFRNHRWGKWRPSACAKRLGPAAVRLETLISRDGLSTNEAVEMFRLSENRSFTHDELLALAEQFPRRPRRRFEGEAILRRMSSGIDPEQEMMNRERAGRKREAIGLLGSSLDRLSSEDRRLLEMRYLNQATVPEIAKSLGVPARPLYRRINQALSRLRKLLQNSGLRRDEIKSQIA